MCISNWEALPLPKESSRRRKKSLAKHHGSDRKCAQQGPAVIQGFGTSAELARKETLMIVGGLFVAIKPPAKSVNGGCDSPN
jgi:hypothetical protein